jgi:Amt family ammonium transporter
MTMKSKVRVWTIPSILLMIMVGQVSLLWAEEGASPIDSGDTAWILVSTALVMLMIPGLAIFYGGMARRKNVLGTIMHSFVCLCMISIQWILIGYTLAFGPDIGGIIGSLSWLGLNGVGVEPSDYASTVPHQAFMIFQGMFAAITPALITGAFAERIKFSTFITFTLLWALFVYDPLAHWVWGGGWMGKLGVLDFAGGIVVHISSGAAALVAALVMGRRKGYLKEPMPPHNLPLTVVGTGLLWFGWFGFNAGSALSSGSQATSTFVVTNTAPAAAVLSWMTLERLFNGKSTVLGAVSGAIAGLGAITPAAGFVSPISAIVIGMISGTLCYYAVVVLKPKLGYDDSLDVFGIHGVSGTWGILSAGLFASSSVGGTDGLFFGNPGQFFIQLIAVAATWAFVCLVTYIIFKVLDATMGLRIPDEEELEGLDLSAHGESGYTM